MEKWKDINGYEKYYQISNLGRVRSKDRLTNSHSGKRLIRGRILSAAPNGSGYMRVLLYKDNMRKLYFVHRLVALHFVDNPNPEVLTIVNHLDSDYLNNSADNLEWTTMKGNTLHALKSGRMKRTPDWLRHLRETNEKNGKHVLGTNLETGETVYFVCLNDCKANGFEPSCVCDCCKGKRKQHAGYTWRYINE